MKKPTKPKLPTHELLSSLKVLDTILEDDGRPYETHLLLRNGWAIANNGVLAIGEKIKEDLSACANADLLIQALSKCGQELSITQLEQTLSIRSNKFRALVPCIPPENFCAASPDNPIALVDDRLKASIAAVAPLPEEGHESVTTHSILIQRGTVTATDRKVIIQHYHGIDLPTIALPKAIIAPLVKNTKKLKSFGYSNSSCTFHYEDESWIKSQFWADQWPEIEPILNRKCNAWPLPEDFYTAVKSLEPFSDDGNVYFDNGIMRLHDSPDKGASYEVYGLPAGLVFNIHQLKIIQPFVKTVDFMAEGPHGSRMLMFFGDNVRGGIAGRR